MSAFDAARSGAHAPTGLDQVAERARRLRASVATMRSAWPDGATFAGADASGQLHITLSSEGRVVEAHLSESWTRDIGARGLARAWNQAIGAASAVLGDTWVESWEAPDATVVEAATRPRLLTLEEYRRAFPAPRTREELRAKADRAAEVRERAAQAPRQPAAREEFVSASGRFRVIRSGATLVGLEADANTLALMTADDVARDLVAIAAQVEHKALGDAHGPVTSRLAQVRQLRDELA